MVVELSDLREQHDDLINTNSHNLGVSPNGDETSGTLTRALGELCRAPWRRRGEKPRLDRMGSKPWRTSIDPFSDSSVSTACTTSKSAPSSPSGGQALILSPMTWPNSPSSVSTSGPEQAEKIPFLSPRCPGGCLNPSLTRDLARADPVTRMMRYQPYSARALFYSTSSTSAAYILPPLSAREPGKDANPRDMLTTAETTVGSASNSREFLTTAESTSTQLAIDPPPDDADLESRFCTSDVEGDVIMASDSEAPRSPRVVDPALMAMLEETVAQLQKVSGVWDPEVWLKAWKALLKHKCVEGVAMLFKTVRITTEWALRKKAYRSLTFVRHSNGLVDLASIFPTARKIHWFGRANVDFPEFMNENETPQKKTPPPLIFTEMKALDVATQLRKIYGKQKQIFVVTELTGFDESGEINLSRQKAMNPYCLPLRSDFSCFLAEASTEMKGSFASMQQHLCAPTDPYVFHSSGVTVFRGARVDGFPFLEDPYQVDVLATAMPPGRPPVQKVHTQEGQSMWYAYRNDHQSLQERYQLLGLVAMQAMRSSLEDPTDLPVLIMTALGSEVKHPCDAIISILKNWRRRFAPYFSSVYVCWGRPSCSNAIDYADDAVNRSIYRLNVLEGISAELAAAKVVQWHWDSRELKMSCARGKMEKAAMQCRKIAKKTSQASGKSGRLTPPAPLIQILAPAFGPSQSGPKIDMSTDQRRETSQNALAALRSLSVLSASNKTEGRTSPGISQSEGEDIESDEDDEPPPSLTHISMAPAIEQLQTPADQKLQRGSHARLSVLPPPSARCSVVSIGGSISGLGASSPKAQRQAALESSKELIGHKSTSATMTGIVLAGGIRNLLGFEKQNESNEDANDSPMRRSMMKTYSKQLKEDGVSVESKKEKKKYGSASSTAEASDIIQEPNKESTGCEHGEKAVMPSSCSKEPLGENATEPLCDGENGQSKEHSMRRHSSAGQFSHVRRLSLQAMESMGTKRRGSASGGEALGLAKEMVAQGGGNRRFSTSALKEQLSDHIHARVENPHDDGLVEHTELDEGHHIPHMMDVERRRRSVEEVMGKGAIVVDRGRHVQDVGNLHSGHTSNKRRMSDIGAMMKNSMESKRRESAEELRTKMREELLKPRKNKDEGPQRRSSLSHVGSKDTSMGFRRGSFSGGEGSSSSAAVAAPQGGRRLSTSMVSSMSRDQSDECLTAKQLSEDLAMLLTRKLSAKGTDSDVTENEDHHYKGEKRSTKKLVTINSLKISVEDKLSVKEEADRLRAQFEMAEKDSSLVAEVGQGRSNSLKSKGSMDFLSNATAKSEDELVSETQEALDRFCQRVGEGGAGNRRSYQKKGSKSSLKIMQAQGFDDEDAPPEGLTKADHRRISCAQQQGVIGGRNLFF